MCPFLSKAPSHGPLVPIFRFFPDLASVLAGDLSVPLEDLQVGQAEALRLLEREEAVVVPGKGEIRTEGSR